MKRKIVTIGESLIELNGSDASGFGVSFAGDMFNVAYYAKNVSNHSLSVLFCTVVGSDPFSDKMVQFISETGVDTSCIYRHKTKTVGIYGIYQQAGDRQFRYWRNASAARDLLDFSDQLAHDLVNADMVVFSGITLAIISSASREKLFNLLSLARSMGTTIAFDPNFRQQLWETNDAARNSIRSGASNADIILPTLSDENECFGNCSALDVVSRYKSLGAKEIIVRDGPAPCTIWCDGKISTVPATRVNLVKDATGAGDSFSGTYLQQRLFGAAPIDAVERAHGIAARVISHHGALIPIDEIEPDTFEASKIMR